jgi:hypothetical protein
MRLEKLKLKADFAYRCMTMAAWPIEKLKILTAENLKIGVPAAGCSIEPGQR